MNKSSFFIIGQHAVFEALRNPKRKVLRVFLTEESKKNIHKKSPNKNLLNDVKVYFKTKKELDKYSTCLLYTSPSPRDKTVSRMPSSA